MGDSASEWQALAVDPQVRLRAIREYALSVLGSPVAVERWLARHDLAVRGGTCTVLTACDGLVGFFEAMAELARISQFRQREARKRASLRERERGRSFVVQGWQQARPAAEAARAESPEAVRS